MPCIVESPTFPTQNDSSACVDDLQFLCSATLTHRKPFLEREEEARTAPNRRLYYRKNADNDKLVEACTAKLRDDPGNIRALMIRASSHANKGGNPRQCTSLAVKNLSLSWALEWLICPTVKLDSQPGVEWMKECT